MRLFFILSVLCLFLSSCTTQRYIEQDGKWKPYIRERKLPVTVTVEEEEKPTPKADFLADCRVEADGRLTKFYKCRYQDIGTVTNIVNTNKSPSGVVFQNVQTNTLVITDTKEGMLRIAESLSQLDVLSPQVLIKVRVLELSSYDHWEYGFEYKQDRSSTEGVIQKIEGTFNPKNYIDSLKPGATPFQGPTFTIKTGGKSGGNIDIIVRALHELGDVNVEACPNLLVGENKTATITSGEEVPFVITTVSGGVVVYSTTYKPVGITLMVKPEFVGYEGVRLYVKAEVSSVTGWTDPSLVGGISNPIVTKKTAETTVSVQDGDLLIFGGLITKRRLLVRRAVPLLGDIPVLGYLFSSNRYENANAILNFLLSIEVLSPLKDEKIPEGEKKDKPSEKK
ncbi:MAG: hypothetical protein N2234_04470 [Planctomycetota bacterium]|nr:hypothetical protein [Planctomycetota bacterium]